MILLAMMSRIPLNPSHPHDRGRRGMSPVLYLIHGVLVTQGVGLIQETTNRGQAGTVLGRWQARLHAAPARREDISEQYPLHEVGGTTEDIGQSKVSSASFLLSSGAEMDSWNHGGGAPLHQRLERPRRWRRSSPDRRPSSRARSSRLVIPVNKVSKARM